MAVNLYLSAGLWVAKNVGQSPTNVDVFLTGGLWPEVLTEGAQGTGEIIIHSGGEGQITIHGQGSGQASFG